MQFTSPRDRCNRRARWRGETAASWQLSPQACAVGIAIFAICSSICARVARVT